MEEPKKPKKPTFRSAFGRVRDLIVESFKPIHPKTSGIYNINTKRLLERTDD